MSVINQMLKDLDNRRAEQPNAEAQRYIPTQTKSPIKVIIATVLVMLCLTVLVLFIWQVYQENQSLKSQVDLGSQTVLERQQPGTSVVPDQVRATDNSSDQIQRLSTSTLTVPESNQSNQSNDSNTLNSRVNALDKNTPQVIDKGNKFHTETHEASTSEFRSTPEPKHEANNEPKHEYVKNRTAEQHSHSHQDGSSHPVRQEQTVEKVASPVESVAEIKPSSLTISRKQISPEALAAKKMKKAERAIADNKMELAETLFEDILLIVPTNQTARKQLAALWYGRQSYQPALNLLQQGIALTPDYQEFRLMKARIFLTIGQVGKAYKVLSVLNESNDIEYQSLLANAAQQIGNFDAAATAYLTLVKLAPSNGRFWLGLGIAYDSNSKFSEAYMAYDSAIIQGGLSNSALQFAKQRMDELGE